MTTKTIPLAIHDNHSVLNKLHNDCSPLQEIRELTVNSIQSIMRTATKSGEIIWDVDWERYEPGASKKLCVVDNGDGISGENMEEFLNHLGAGIQSRDQDGDTNYGIGAKVAALPLNKCGLLYQSWIETEDFGFAIKLGLDAQENAYGILPMEGKIRTKIKGESAPEIICNAGHGTKVTMYGNDPRADTLNKPDSAMGGAKWLSRYLNGKFFSVPEGITIYAREWQEGHPPREQGHQKSPNFLRAIQGMRSYLEDHAESSGSVRLENGIVEDGTLVPATAYWWILKDSKVLDSANSYLPSKGHVACLMDNNSVTEIYEPKKNCLMKFGVLYEQKRVFIYIKPDPITGLTTSSGRDRLKIGRHNMPWGEWEKEFSDKIPQEITDLYENDPKSTKSMKEKLEKLHDFLMDFPTYAKINRAVRSRFKIKKVGPGEDGPGGVYERNGHGPNSRKNPRPGPIPSLHGKKGRGGVIDVIDTVEIVEEETDTRIINDIDIPVVMWVSQYPDKKLNIKQIEPIEGDGHELDTQLFEMDDRMAQYLEGPNIIRANFDFRGMVHFLSLMIGNEKNKAKQHIITLNVMESFEIALTETVLGVKSLAKGDEGKWSNDDIQNALSEETLTAAVMQKYYSEQVLNRNINRRAGTPKRRAFQK